MPTTSVHGNLVLPQIVGTQPNGTGRVFFVVPLDHLDLGLIIKPDELHVELRLLLLGSLGLLLDLPVDFFTSAIHASGHDVRDGRLAVGVIFLPRTDLGGQDACRTIVEAVLIRAGLFVYGWRQVPVDIKALGKKAIATRPEIEQIMFSMPVEMDATDAERQLYIVRRRIEKAVIRDMISDFYLCSLSSRSIIYKGMFLAEQVTAFFPDLLDQRFH